MRKIWYLPGPFDHYVENVKDVARKADVRIVDSNYMHGDPADWPDRCESEPRVTLRTGHGAAPALSDEQKAAMEAMAAAAAPKAKK